MTKRIICLIASLLLCFCGVSTVLAEEKASRLTDGAGLLTKSEYESVKSTLDELSERLQFDVIIRTVSSTGSKDIEDAADDIYDYNDYGYGEDYDGVLLLISMEDSRWYISTSGYGETAFTNAGIDHIGDKIESHLSDEEYKAAFVTFAELCEEFVTRARDGDPYDSHNLPKDPYDPVSSIGISVVIAFVIALIATGVMKGKLKSVHRQTRASQYVRDGSMNVTNSNDFFLYRTLTRVPRPKQSNSSGSSTHTSSSGRSHGGGGGRF